MHIKDIITNFIVKDKKIIAVADYFYSNNIDEKDILFIKKMERQLQ
ncbi:hypothetical protein CLAUR_012510 [Clostridium felsineum]|nr:hypothetical protein CLAUR_012510 [Clostridium felsineum]